MVNDGDGGDNDLTFVFYFYFFKFVKTPLSALIIKLMN